jgi:hypothetical protein
MTIAQNPDLPAIKGAASAPGDFSRKITRSGGGTF